MKIHLGGQTILLDKTGAAILVEEKVVVIGSVAFNSSQAELFPEFASQQSVEDAVTEIVGVHAPSLVVVVNSEGTADEPSLRDFLSSLGVEAVFVGHGELDSIAFGDLTVGGDSRQAPAIRTGRAPDVEGDSRFVLNSDCLTLPEFRPRDAAPGLRESGLVLVSALA